MPINETDQQRFVTNTLATIDRLTATGTKATIPLGFLDRTAATEFPDGLIRFYAGALWRSLPHPLLEHQLTQRALEVIRYARGDLSIQLGLINNPASYLHLVRHPATGYEEYHRCVVSAKAAALVHQMGITTNQGCFLDAEFVTVNLTPAEIQILSGRAKVLVGAPL